MLQSITVTHNRSTHEYQISFYMSNGRTMDLTMDGVYGSDAENLLDFLKMHTPVDYLIYGNNNSGFLIDIAGMLMVDNRKVTIA